MSEHPNEKHTQAHAGCKTQQVADSTVASTTGKTSERSGGQPQAAPKPEAKKAASKKGCCG